MAYNRGVAQPISFETRKDGVPTDPGANFTLYIRKDGGAEVEASDYAHLSGGFCYATLTADEMDADHVILRWEGDDCDTDGFGFATEDDYTDTRATRLDKLDVAGTLAHSDAAGIYKADVSGLSTLAEAEVEAIIDEIKGAGWTNETLVNLMAEVEAVTGDGAYEIEFAVSDGAGTLASSLKTQIEDAGGNLVAGPITTDSSGEVTYWLDEGTYYFVTPSIGRWQGSSTEFTVEESGSEAITLTAHDIPDPPSSDYCTVYCYENSVANNPAASGKLKVTHVHSPDSDGSGASTVTVTWDDQDEDDLNASGFASLPLLRGAVVDLELQLTGAKNVKRTRRVVPDEDTVNWEQMEQQDA